MSTPATPFYPMTHDDALALIAALQAMDPGLVTTSQAGKLAPNAECIENGFIKNATPSNKGLMTAAYASVVEGLTDHGIFTRIPRWLRFDATNKKGLIIKAGTHLIKQNGDLHGDWDGKILDVEKYRNVTFEPYDLKWLEIC